MTDLPPTDPARPSSDDSGSARNWRERYDAARRRGVDLNPKSEPVQGVRAYPTTYDPDHLLLTARADDIAGVLELLTPAGADFGWGIDLQNLDGTPLDLDEAVDRSRRGRELLDLPTIYRVQIVPRPSPDRDDQPVPPIDAWRLLQRARARNGTKLQGLSLDHVLSLDPFGGKTNPFGGKTNPFGGKTNPFGGKTNPIDSYGEAGHGGRQVVTYIGPEPRRSRTLTPGARRPVVAVLDTGCGRHEWLPQTIVTTYPRLENRIIGVGDPTTDPEIIGDVAGPYDGAIDESSGHGTFIAGVIRQVAPEADIIAVRVADSQGTVLEGHFMLAVRSLVKMMALPVSEGGRPIDVLNLSLGYYHETPDDELFDRTLSELLVAARRLGCAVVCSAGNDATDRPSFPAALWAWPGAEFVVEDPSDAAPHVSVGALNPNGTMAMFSNLGPWVRTYALGAAVLSTHPPLNGGMQADARDDRDGVRRETIDPDDFRGGFALWSGTSFAAPLVAGKLADAIAERLMAGKLTSAQERIAALRTARTDVESTLALRGPTPA